MSITRGVPPTKKTTGPSLQTSTDRKLSDSAIRNSEATKKIFTKYTSDPNGYITTDQMITALRLDWGFDEPTARNLIPNLKFTDGKMSLPDLLQCTSYIESQKPANLLETTVVKVHSVNQIF
jgi:hypothetical protein